MFEKFFGSKKEEPVVVNEIKVEEIVPPAPEMHNFSIEEIANAKKDIETLLEEKNNLRLKMIKDQHVAENDLKMEITKEIAPKEFAGEAVTGESMTRYHQITKEIQDIGKKYSLDIERIELPYDRMHVSQQAEQLKEFYPKFHRERINPMILESFKTMKTHDGHVFPDIPGDNDHIELYSNGIKNTENANHSTGVGKNEFPRSALGVTLEICRKIGISMGGRQVMWKDLKKEIKEKMERIEEENKATNREHENFELAREGVVKFDDVTAKKRAKLEEEHPFLESLDK